MYAFLIVFAIVIPRGEATERQSFDIRSGRTFDRATCAAKAKETADYAAQFATANIPGAELQIKVGCYLQDSFPA